MFLYGSCVSFFLCLGVHRYLHGLTHSVPTRRSSDLACAVPDAGQAVKPIPVSTLGLGSVSSPNIDATWWTSLGDPQLDRIMSDALSGSPRLDAALARVRQARSVLAARSAEDLQIGRAHV